MKEPKTQKTQPKQGKPATIPVPKKGDFDKVLGKAIHPKDRPKS